MVVLVNSKFKIPNLRDLFKSLKNARSEWKLKTPMQKWCYFYGIAKAAYGFSRIPLMNDGNHVHWLGYFLLVYMGAIMLLSPYTIIYYALRGQLELALPSTCVALLCIGHYPICVVMTFKNRFKLRSLIDFGGRYIYHDSHVKTDYNRICSDQMDRTMKKYISKLATIGVSLIVAAIAPIYAYIANGILSTTIETRIPFTEPKSNAEFMGNLLLQCVSSLQAIPSYIGIECILSVMENVATTAPRLIKLELAQTIKLFEGKLITKLELHSRIGNIVKQSNDTDNYVDTLSKLFYWRNFFTPTAFTAMVGMCIFCQYAVDFPSGYGMALMSWTQLFVCNLGEKIQDNGFAEMLYQTKWEVLPIDIQKTILLLIHRKQNEKGLSLGPFGISINREAFKLSTNKIYTLVMFLKNFFK